MEFSDDDSNYMVKFKTAFTKNLPQRIATLNHQRLKIATLLDPDFKDLKCLAGGEQEEVWTSLEALLQEQYKVAITKEPAKIKSLHVSSLSSDSDSDEEALCNRALSLYRAESIISKKDCPLQWWSGRAGSHPQLSVLAHKYLIIPGTSVNKLVCLSNWLKDMDSK